MAQTTVAMSSKNGKVEYSLDATTFVDISGTANSVTPSGGDRKSGEAYTADGDTALLVTGKREPIEVVVKVLYTEATGTPNAFEPLATVYASGAGACIRWSPTAYTASASNRYTTAGTAGTAMVCPITKWSFPALDFASGDPVMVEFTVRCPAILTEEKSA